MPIGLVDRIVLALAVAAATPALAQNDTYTPWTDEQVLSHTHNPSSELRLQAWPAFRIIDNIHYVGTRNLGSFLITTPEGHILVNTTYEETLPLVRKSVEELGFRWADIKIVLGSHAHADHMSGNALMKQQTGAQIMAMAEDLPLLVQMKPGGKPHPIDRVLRDEDTVSLGGVTMTAHLTPGHTPGSTAWTLKARENGRTYDVVILSAATATARFDITGPEIQGQFHRAFIKQRSLPCDVPLGPHNPMYEMEEKFARLRQSPESNPFIDPAGCQKEMSFEERVFYLRLQEQLRARRENVSPAPRGGEP